MLLCTKGSQTVSLMIKGASTWSEKIKLSCFIIVSAVLGYSRSKNMLNYILAPVAPTSFSTDSFLTVMDTNVVGGVTLNRPFLYNENLRDLLHHLSSTSTLTSSLEDF